MWPSGPDATRSCSKSRESSEFTWWHWRVRGRRRYPATHRGSLHFVPHVNLQSEVMASWNSLPYDICYLILTKFFRIIINDYYCPGSLHSLQRPRPPVYESQQSVSGTVQRLQVCAPRIPRIFRRSQPHQVLRWAVAATIENMPARNHGASAGCIRGGPPAACILFQTRRNAFIGCGESYGREFLEKLRCVWTRKWCHLLLIHTYPWGGTQIVLSQTIAILAIALRVEHPAIILGGGAKRIAWEGERSPWAWSELHHRKGPWWELPVDFQNHWGIRGPAGGSMLLSTKGDRCVASRWMARYFLWWPSGTVVSG